MNLQDLLAYGALPVLMAIVGYIIRELSMIKAKLSEKMSEAQVDRLIDLKQATLDLRQQDLKEDLLRLESKIDRVLEEMSTKIKSEK